MWTAFSDASWLEEKRRGTLSSRERRIVECYAAKWKEKLVNSDADEFRK